MDLSCEESRLVDTLIAAGEYDMAALYVKDQDEFNRRRNLGCEYFHGKLPAAVEDVEAWLDELAERISEFATWDCPDDGFACRGRRETMFWSVTVYPYPVEIVDGANDGAEAVPAFQLDLHGVVGLFDEIDEFYWDTSAIGPSDCPLIRIEGRYEGQYVYLSVLAQRPKEMAEFPKRASQWRS